MYRTTRDLRHSSLVEVVVLDASETLTVTWETFRGPHAMRCAEGVTCSGKSRNIAYMPPAQHAPKGSRYYHVENPHGRGLFEPRGTWER